MWPGFAGLISSSALVVLSSCTFFDATRPAMIWQKMHCFLISSMLCAWSFMMVGELVNYKKLFK